MSTAKEIHSLRVTIEAYKQSLKWMSTAQIDGMTWLGRDKANRVIQEYVILCHHLQPSFKDTVMMHMQQELAAAERDLEIMLHQPGEDHGAN